jgi:hypothetical protein
MNCNNKMNLEIFDINLHEKKIYSQNGEDGILEFIFSKIGTTNKFSVEFGVGNGFECNTVHLLEKKGWTGLMMDYGADQDVQWKEVLKKVWSNRNIGISRNIKKYTKFSKKIIKCKERSMHFKLDIKNERITAENIENLFKKYQVPENFDLLSIDIDYNDFWIWKAITKFHPRVLVIEFNSSIPPTESRVVPYDADAQWDGTNYFGASLLALQNLSLEKNYTLLGCDNNGVNAFFCKSELVKTFKIPDINDLYRSPNYGEKINGIHIGHTPSDKKMIEI